MDRKNLWMIGGLMLVSLLFVILAVWLAPPPGRPNPMSNPKYAEPHPWYQVDPVSADGAKNNGG